ncbi:large membrane with signal peptide and transmembrane domain near carboxy terminus [Cryptosporidium xiaoi]|uniref:Large membrane with signal peptide and transmembrane domain near carboxy terminus n=1 Tax=Cryptosporidium xiaoi TaxID=659607 RepID=A0AAV9Y2C1_9CRYT
MIPHVGVFTRILTFLVTITIYFICVVSSSLNRINPALSLLPWTLNNTSQIEIRGDKGCYSWEVDLDENIKIKNGIVRIDPQGNECIDTIIVRPLWQYEYIKGVFMIRARDIYSDEYFRSEIHVARIESISIVTSSKRIRVGSLEALTAIGYDREMNTFSSLEGIEIIWKLDNNHIVSEKNEGVQITVLGSSVGSTVVHVYAMGKGVDNSKLSSKVIIYVEDPFRIVPSTRRVPFGSEFEIKLLRETVSASATSIYDERYHKCEITTSEQKARIYNNKILINTFDGGSLYDEQLINITCNDKRVQGSLSSSIMYISFPSVIKFAVYRNKPLLSEEYINVSESVNAYNTESEGSNELGIFDFALEKGVINITKDKIFFFQIKLIDYNQNYLSVPMNSVFRFVCKSGCDSFSIISISQGNGNNQIHGGLFQFEAISTGSTEISFQLISIGEMIYSNFEEAGDSKIIEATLNINIVDEMTANFHSFPIVLYPGGEKINLYDYISGGRGPFYFCSKDISIVDIDPLTGVIVTKNVAGEVEIIVYDIGIIMQLNEIDDTVDCSSLDEEEGLVLPLIVSYVDRIDFAPISSNAVVHNNTIYTSISKGSIKLYFVPIWEIIPRVNVFDVKPQYEASYLYSQRLKTLDILKLRNPCSVLKIIYNQEPLINEEFVFHENTEFCIERLDSLYANSFVNLVYNYDKRIISIELVDQEILIKLEGPGNIYIDNFIEFGVEFVVGSNKYKHIIITKSINIHIFGDLKFMPIIEERIFKYYKTLNIMDNEFFIEKSSSLVINLEGIFETDILATRILYNRSNLYFSNNEFIGESSESPTERSSFNTSINELGSGKNAFLLQCVDESSEIYNFTIEFYEEVTQVYSVEIQIKVFCRRIDYINVFWLNESPLIGKYTCNSRNENCLAFHFNSKMMHRFVALSYDLNHNMILSYNSYKVDWMVNNIKEYNITYGNQNSQLGSNIVDLMVYLDKDNIIRDVDLLFEALPPTYNEDSEPYSDKCTFKVSTKGIFIRPPVLISPNMVINSHDDSMNYHINSKGLNRDATIYDLGTWNLIEGEHQLGVIYGTNNYNIYLQDGSIINYSLCNDYLKEKNSNLKYNYIGRDLLVDLNTYLFCLDSNAYFNGENSRSVVIFVEDRLMLPKLVIKKELVFSKLYGAELIWIDRFFSVLRQDMGGIIQGVDYSFFSDTGEGFGTMRIPYQYIWVLELNKFIYNFKYSRENNIPCLDRYICITNNIMNTFLIVLLTNNKGEIMEPWQNNVRVEIMYNIENSIKNEGDFEYLIPIDTDTGGEIIITSFLCSVLFQVEKILLHDIVVKFRAKAFDVYSNNFIYSNSVDLKVYDSIELESGVDKIFLFPFGYPLHLSFTGGPVGYNIGDLEFQWHMYLVEDGEKEMASNDILRDNILLIRNSSQLILEPLGTIGNARVRIEYFLSKIKSGDIIFKSLLYSTSIDVFVDIPDKIDIISSDPQFTYIGYKKIYILKARKNDNEIIQYFHNSQFIPSLLTQCNIRWYIQTKDESDDKGGGCISLIKNDLAEYYNFKYEFPDSGCNNDIYSMKDYSILFYPIKGGEFELSVELKCNFSNNESNIQLSCSQKINAVEEIDGIEKTTFLVNNTIYHFKVQNSVEIGDNDQFDLLYVNNSKFVYLDTSKGSSFIIRATEKRFIQENFPMTTLIPIVPTEPKMSIISVSKYDSRTLSISVLIMNSMGILIYPNIGYCEKLRVNISSFHNDQNMVNTIITRVINRGKEPLYSSGRIGSLVGFCQVLIEFKDESPILKNILNESPLIDNGYVIDGLKPFSIKSSCFVIQVSSINKTNIGSQSFCYSNYGMDNSYDIVNYKHDEVNIELLNNRKELNVFNIDVLKGSIIHLNPLKWKMVNLIPERLTFCVFLREFENKSALIEELLDITNIPRSFISFQHSNLDSKIREFNNEPINANFTCININKRVDPFELWELLMRNIPSVSKSSGIFWIDNPEEFNSNIEYKRDNRYYWKLETSINSVKIIENDILFIPFDIGLSETIKLSLSGIELNINVVNGQINFSESIGSLKMRDDKFLINMPFSFSVYSYKSESKTLFNPFFSNIYYSPPIKNIICTIEDPLLRDVYNVRTFWDVTIYKVHYLAPSCEIYPRSDTLTEEAINRIVNGVFDLRYLFINTSLRNESFKLELKHITNPSTTLNSPVLVNFHPIFLREKSSIYFSHSCTTINQHWDSNSSFQIKMVIPKGSSEYPIFKSPLNIHFWFGYFNTQLTAFSIKSKSSEKYLVKFIPDNIQGVIQISKSNDFDLAGSRERSQTQEPSLNISLEFLSNKQKHYVQILFVDEKENIVNKNFHTSDFSSHILWIAYIIRRNMFILLTSLILFVISILHLRPDRKYTENSRNSPFRKLNSRKLQVSISDTKVI